MGEIISYDPEKMYGYIRLDEGDSCDSGVIVGFSCCELNFLHNKLPDSENIHRIVGNRVKVSYVVKRNLVIDNYNRTAVLVTDEKN